MKTMMKYLYVCLLPIALVSQAEASQCIDLQIDGSWSAFDPKTKSITKIDIKHECKKVPSKISPTLVKSVYHTTVWGKCHPKDCEWGAVQGAIELYGGGAVVKAEYKDSSSKRILIFNKYSSGILGGMLVLQQDVDFVQAGVPDYKTIEVFKK